MPGPQLTVEIVGRPYSETDRAYLEDLERLAREMNLEQKVTFAGFVPYTQIASHYHQADIAVNLTPKGGIDKAVLESMASGCLTLTSNEAFRSYFGTHADQLIFEHNNHRDLSKKIQQLILLEPLQKKQISSDLQQVARQHTVENVIASISRFFA